MNDPIVASSSVPSVGYDFLTPILRLLFGESGVVTGIGIGGLFTFLGIIWTLVVIFGYGLSFLFLYLYVYAAMHRATLGEIAESRIKAHEHAAETRGGERGMDSRIVELRTHVDSDNPNDWKLAIIEADIILDELLKKRGYVGTSLGERLRSISPTAMATLDDAWQAHKVRNNIAHGGDEFVLTQKIAMETIMRYERVFAEFGII